jgi:hypothetical protein
MAQTPAEGLTADQRIDRLERALAETADRVFAALGRTGEPRPALVALVADVEQRLAIEAKARQEVEEQERHAMLERVAERTHGA